MSAISFGDRLDSFFRERLKYRTLRPQFLIVLLAGIAFSLDMFSVYGLMWGQTPRQVYGGVVLILGIAYVFIPLFVWIGAVIGIYVVGRIVGARIQFGILLRATGWGMIPFVGTGLALSAGRFLALRGSGICDGGELACKASAYRPIIAQVNDIYAYMAGAASQPVFVAAYVVAIVCFLATAAVWIVAAEDSSTLTTAGATLTVGVVALVMIVGLTLSTF